MYRTDGDPAIRYAGWPARPDLPDIADQKRCECRDRRQVKSGAAAGRSHHHRKLWRRRLWNGLDADGSVMTFWFTISVRFWLCERYRANSNVVCKTSPSANPGLARRIGE